MAAEGSGIFGSVDEGGDESRRARHRRREVHDPVAQGERRLDHLPTDELLVLARGQRVGDVVERRITDGELWGVDGGGAAATVNAGGRALRAAARPHRFSGASSSAS